MKMHMKRDSQLKNLDLFVDGSLKSKLKSKVRKRDNEQKIKGYRFGYL